MMKVQTFLGAAAMLAACGTALAQPPVNSARVNTRIFNDDSNSNLVVANNYPASIAISDTILDGDGIGGEFANLHNFRFSRDGGATPASFANGSSFSIASDVTITGPANAEGGLQISPWYSSDVDGRFNVRTGDGEIAVFGGALPFYSFTGSQGLTYTAGTTVRLGMNYQANGNSLASPGTIEYTLRLGGVDYTSGILPFGEQNPSEGPTYGTYGILNFAQVGGHFQPQIQVGNTANGSNILWGDISFIPAPSSLALIGLGGLAAMRRRR